MKKSKNLAYIGALCACVTMTSISYATSYSDLTDGNWAKPAIEEMASKGYIGGYEDGTFRPSKEITRAELLTIINKMNDFTEEADITFTDVSSTNWAYREIKKAVAAGYVAGFSDNTFKPNENVTREQIAVMLNNLYKLEEKDENINIADIENIASWAKTAVKNVVSNGIMNGYSDGTFGGKRRITRAEGVVALNNLSKTEIFGSISKNDMDQEGSEAQEIQNQEPEINTDVQAPSGGSSGGGSTGGSSGGGSAPTDEQKVNENLQKALSTFNNRVAPKYSTDNQKQVGAVISESIEKYLNDSSYDISSDVQKARDISRNMTQEERNEFKNITTRNMDYKLLLELNNTFNIVNF